MKTLHIIFAILFALLAGWSIQLAGKLTGILQIIEYGVAIFQAGYCFAHINKTIREDE